LSDPVLRAELRYGIKNKIIFSEIASKITAISAVTPRISYTDANQ